MDKIVDCNKCYKEDNDKPTGPYDRQPVMQREEKAGSDQVIKEESQNKSLNDKNSFNDFLLQ